MKIAVDRSSNVVVFIGQLQETWPNGYPVLQDSVGNSVAFPPEFIEIMDVDVVPEDVIPIKYCYSTNKQFYLNEEYVEANKYGVSSDIISEIKDEAISEVQQEVTNNANS